MNRLDLLKNRRAELLKIGKEIRDVIDEIIDPESFVELSAYSFSKNEFYGENAEGEGVVTGYATVDGSPLYIVAQNGKVLSGGVSKANCDKIRKAQAAAQNSAAPVLYILDTKGVQIGEGVTVLEGIAGVIRGMNELRGEVPQFALVNGDCFGAFSLVAAACDFTFYTKNSCVAYASPAVIAATAKHPIGKDVVGGIPSLSKTGIAEFVVGELSEVRAKIIALLDLLPATGRLYADTDDDLNRCAPDLNEKVCPKCLVSAAFDEGTFIELGKGYASDVVCGLGRIGGVSVGAVIFGGGEDGVSLNPQIVDKIDSFVSLVSAYDLPLINFVNAKGIDHGINVNNSTILKDVANLCCNLQDLPKIGVVYGKAVGLGYSIFAAKSMGYDYSYAFCNSKISLFDTLEGAYVEFGNVRPENEKIFAEKYAEENQDPINAAKGGYIDNVIEPQFVRQYLISALQMIVR